MIIITAVMYSIPYFICLVWFLHLRKQNKKQRIEFLDFKIVTSENFMIANKNYKGQDENWESQDKINKRQKQTNQEHLEVFQEFDYIIQGLDKKVNSALDDQEKYSIKRDRYENRLTEVCKVVDSLKDVMNKNTKLTIDNFGSVNRAFDSVNENLDAHIENTKNGFELHSLLHDKTIEFMESTERILSQKQTLKEILENPIEVEKPKCETRIRLNKEAEANEVESVTEIVNKVEFEWLGHKFDKGSVFVWKNGNLEAKRYTSKNNAVTVNFRESFAQSLWEKVLEVNEPKPKRKYTKKNEKQSLNERLVMGA
jgi:hypothetical protein